MPAKERDRLEKRVREISRLNKALEHDNADLGSKIEELSAEVTSSRVYIDRLLKTSHETQISDWEKKEAQYKAAIRNYQQQIRKQASTVSLDLYKKAVDENKRAQTQLEKAEGTIQKLETKVSSLENAGSSSRATKSPGTRRDSGGRNLLMSPTDFLEKGLLSGDYKQEQRQQSPSLYGYIPSSLKKPKTPLSQTNEGAEFTGSAAGKKSTTWADLPQQSRTVETMDVSRNVRALSFGDESSRRIEELALHRKPHHGDENLIGMTISFPSSPSGLPCPKESPLQSPPQIEFPVTGDIDEWLDRYAQKHLSSTEEKGRFTSSKSNQDNVFIAASKGIENVAFSPSWKPTPRKRSPVTTRGNHFVGFTSPNACTPGSKENQSHRASPKSGSKTLRMRKARELGGMKGLKNHLNKIRSPQPLGKPVRVLQVLRDRQFN